jgi:hypothetical protein
MPKFSSTMLFFVIGLLLAVLALGVGTAYVSKLKQQRRQPSDNRLVYGAPHQLMHARGIVDADMNEFPTDAVVTVTRARISVVRCPTESIRLRS